MTHTSLHGETTNCNFLCVVRPRINQKLGSYLRYGGCVTEKINTQLLALCTPSQLLKNLFVQTTAERSVISCRVTLPCAIVCDRTV